MKLKRRTLTPEEILCLQWAGTLPADIMATRPPLHLLPDAIDNGWERAEAVMARQRQAGVTTLAFHDADFPAALRLIRRDCPPLVHLLGDASLLAADASRIAVIGARTASPAALRKAYELGERLAREGHIVVSGLAAGCDQAAHEGCLAAGGRTIAVVATGLDSVHPADHAPLQQRLLAAGGLVVTEQPFGARATPARLVARNRLQAALSASVVLVESPERGGSLHTMRFARRYHKACYAATFPDASAANAGNRLLIEQGLALPL